MFTTKERNELLTRAQNLLNTKPFSKQAEAEFSRVMQLVDVIDADKKHERALQSLQEHDRDEAQTAELRAEAQFKEFVRYRGMEKRTYSSLAEGAAPGSYVVPTGQWRREYQSRLVSASGWLQAGITIKSTQTGRPYISFFDDDSANFAQIQATENTLLPAANPTFSCPTATPVAFASSTLLSNQLNQDVQNGSFDVDGFLQTLLGKRVGRAFNTWATNDATYGLLPQISVSATAASTTTPTLAELVGLQAALNQAYLEADSKPVYVMSQTLKLRLAAVTDANGRRLYPEIDKGMLLGLPCIVNADMVATPGSTAVVCGSVARLAIVEDVAPTLIKSLERYVEYFQTMFGIVHRLGVKLVDSNAATALQLHS